MKVKHIVFFTFWVLLSFTMGGCNKVIPVEAGFTASASEALAGDNIQFTNSSENANYYQWDFGDGGTSFDKDPTHVFEDDGRYDVELIAIGEDDSDTASVEVDVFWPFEITIFEGTGIEEVFVLDTWANSKSVYTSDTVYFQRYLESIELFRHIVFYPDEGVAYFFFNEDTLINNEDQLEFLLLLPPYLGGTTKKVGIGSTMKRVLDSYGSPEEIDAGNGFEGYWYDSKGVDFYTYESGYVEEIYIYSNSAKKMARSKVQLLSNLNRNFLD